MQYGCMASDHERGTGAVVPKKVDHEQRRRSIADALWRVTEDEGLEGVSLRRVAAEAGVSVGLVQHYFHTREQMLLFALDSAGERMAARLGATTEPDGHASPKQAIRQLLIQFLPLDEARQAESRSLFTFLAEAASGGPVGLRVRDGMAQLRRFVTARVAEAGVTSDPQQVATVLLALTDGLATHVLARHLTAEEALDALDGHLDATLPR